MPANTSKEPVGLLSHGELTFTLDDCTLRRAGAVVNLTLRAASILRTLLLRPGEEVSKQDLIEQAWQNRTISDTAITKRMQELRQALDDDARAPVHIETCHGRGYRLISKWSRRDQERSGYLYPHARLAADIYSHWRNRRGDAVDVVIGDIDAGHTQCAMDIGELGHRNQQSIGLGRCTDDNDYQPLLDAFQGVMRDSERQVLELVADDMPASELLAEQLLQGSLPMSGAILILLDCHLAKSSLLDAIVRLKKKSHGDWLLIISGQSDPALEHWAREHRDMPRWRTHTLERLDLEQMQTLLLSQLNLANQAFAVWMKNLTGGIPQLTERCVEQLSKHNPASIADNSEHPARAQLASYVFGQMDASYARLLTLATALPERFRINDLQKIADVDAHTFRDQVSVLTETYAWLKIEREYATFVDTHYRAAAQKQLLAFERERLQRKLITLRG